jgi:hypothetical protein
MLTAAELASMSPQERHALSEHERWVADPWADNGRVLTRNDAGELA